MERRNIVRRQKDRAPGEGEFPVNEESVSTEQGERRSGVDRRAGHTITPS